MTPGSQSRRAWWLIAGAVLLAVMALGASVFVGDRLGNRNTAEVGCAPTSPDWNPGCTR